MPSSSSWSSELLVHVDVKPLQKDVQAKSLLDLGLEKAVQTPAVDVQDCDQGQTGIKQDSAMQTEDLKLSSSQDPASANINMTTLKRFLGKAETIMSPTLIANAQSTAFRSWNARWDLEESLIASSSLEDQSDLLEKLSSSAWMGIHTLIQPPRTGQMQCQCSAFGRQSLAVGYGSQENAENSPNNGMVMIWLLKTVRELNRNAQSSRVLAASNMVLHFASAVAAIAFLDDKYLACGLYDGSVVVSCISLENEEGAKWQSQSGQDKAHVSEISNLYWATNSTSKHVSHLYLYSASVDGKIVKWQFDDGKRTLMPIVHYTSNNLPISYICPHEENILTGCYNGSLSLVDITNNRTIMNYSTSIFPQKNAHACSLSFIQSLTSTATLTASMDGCVKIWNVKEKTSIYSARPLASNEATLTADISKIDEQKHLLALGTDSGFIVLCLLVVDKVESSLIVAERINMTDVLKDSSIEVESSKNYTTSNFESLQTTNSKTRGPSVSAVKSLSFSRPSSSFIGGQPYLTVCMDSGIVCTTKISFSKLIH